MSGRFRQGEQRLCAVGLCAALLMAVASPAYDAAFAAQQAAATSAAASAAPRVAASAAGYAMNTAAGSAPGSQTTGGRATPGKHASSAILKRLGAVDVSGNSTAAPTVEMPGESREPLGLNTPGKVESLALKDVSGNAVSQTDVSGNGLIALSADASAGGEATPAEQGFSAEEEARIAAFYANTVLAGDSVLLGFRNYCRSADPLMQKLQFLAAGSYSLHNAFWEISGRSVHPLYQGVQRQLWDSVGMIAPNRIFLFFGINDMAFGVDESVTLYEELIGRVKAADPGATIYLISATYVLEGTGKKGLNNENLARFNQIMAQKAAANGWGYVDMATATSDGRGNLLPAYCSDGHLHQSKSAYVTWERVLKEYALRETAAGR